MAQPIFIHAPLTRTLLDAIPLPLFVVDWDVSILDANQAARDLLDAPPEHFLRRRGGEALHCVHARESERGCGTTEICSDCVLRNAVRAAEHGEDVVRRKAELQRADGGPGRRTHVLVTARRFEHEGEARALLMLEDITEWMELGRLIPICASCKKIRNDSQYWEQLESYLARHAGLEFTHGYCPDCAERFLRESESQID